MDWFTEKFMEDCIAEAPEAFLKREMTLRARQPRVRGFIPDLIFSEGGGGVTIVEVQKDALDRYHLYRCLEYRDMLYEENPTLPIPVVAIVCEQLPDKYKGIIKTHNVQLFHYERDEIVAMAIRACPGALEKHLAAHRPFEDVASPRNEKMRPYKWRKYDSLADVYEYTVRELSRCDAWDSLSVGNRYHDIMFMAKDLLEGRRRYGDLLDPEEWRVDNLKSQSNKWAPPHLAQLARIRKPRATAYVYMTSKGNLSVRWYPSGATGWQRDGVHDWVKAPEIEPYVYQRPGNELLFIKDIDRFWVDCDSHMHVRGGEDHAAIHSMMLGLIWSSIQHLYNMVSKSIDLEILSEFQLMTGSSAEEDDFWNRRDVVGWRIIDSSDLEREAAAERIEKFESTHGVSRKLVIEKIELITSQNSARGDPVNRVVKMLREIGHKISAAPIRSLLDDLKLMGHPDYARVQQLQTRIGDAKLAEER